MKKPHSSSRQRAEVIMKVRCGLMSASEAAVQLGVSRKTYYKWEQRGLAALLDGLCDQKAGRPEMPQRESAIEKQLADSLRKNELLRQQMALKDLVSAITVRCGSDRTKKNERIMQAVAHIQKIKTRLGVPYLRIVRETGIRYSSFMRWKRRIAAGDPPTRAPGPKKIEPLDLDKLTRKIEKLPHSRKRTRDTGRLHESYKSVISRRELNAMIIRVRRDIRREQSLAMSRVIWHRPDVAWALDGTEHRAGFAPDKQHVQNLQDLCSRPRWLLSA